MTGYINDIFGYVQNYIQGNQSVLICLDLFVTMKAGGGSWWRDTRDYCVVLLRPLVTSENDARVILVKKCPGNCFGLKRTW